MKIKRDNKKEENAEPLMVWKLIDHRELGPDNHIMTCTMDGKPAFRAATKEEDVELSAKFLAGLKHYNEKYRDAFKRMPED